jgi:hypothetical protein
VDLSLLKEKVKRILANYQKLDLLDLKFANQRPVKMASKISGLDLLFFYFVFLRYRKTTAITPTIKISQEAAPE